MVRKRTGLRETPIFVLRHRVGIHTERRGLGREEINTSLWKSRDAPVEHQTGLHGGEERARTRVRGEVCSLQL